MASSAPILGGGIEIWLRRGDTVDSHTDAKHVRLELTNTLFIETHGLASTQQRDIAPTANRATEDTEVQAAAKIARAIPFYLTIFTK